MGGRPTIVVDTTLPTPVFEQVRAQVAAARDSGRYPPGHRLPTVRQLAAELGVAPNTVARAYRELEASAVIETRGRAGSFISATTASAERVGAAAAREYVATIRRLHLGPEDAERLLRAALAGSEPDAGT